MLPLYVGSLALGGVLIIASIVLGDTDTDADLDLDADVDLDVGLDGDQDALLVLKDPGDAVADAGIWLPFFSLRFWTFALAGFGASGCCSACSTSRAFSRPGSPSTGGILGTGAAWVFRQLQLTEPTGNVGLLDVNGSSHCLISVGQDKPGKIL